MPLSLPVIVTIIVIAFLAFFLIKGLRKGFLRILFTTFSVIVTIALSALFTQSLADFLEKSTFVGPTVEGWVSEYVDGRLEDLSQKLSAGHADSSQAEGSQTNSSQAANSQTDNSQAGLVSSEASAESEDLFINALALPEFIKSNIRLDNTLEKYRDLGVATFSEYITAQLTRVSIRAIAFVLLAIVIYIFLRIIFSILRVIQKIPILRGINRLLGGILGLAEGLLIVWGICIIIIIFSGTSFGTSCMEVIQASKILTYIYDHNLLVKAIHAVFGLL